MEKLPECARNQQLSEPTKQRDRETQGERANSPVSMLFAAWGKSFKSSAATTSPSTTAAFSCEQDFALFGRCSPHAHATPTPTQHATTAAAITIITATRAISNNCNANKTHKLIGIERPPIALPIRFPLSDTVT